MTTTPPLGSSRATSASRVVLARTWARASLLAVIGAAIALSIGLVCGLFAVTSLEAEAAIRAAVPGPGDSGGWLQVQTRPSADAAGQDAEADALFGALLGGAAIVERLELGEPGSDLARVAWRVIPNLDALTADAVAQLARGLDQLPSAFRESDAAEGGSSASGTLAATMETVNQGVSAAAAMAPVPLVILAVLAWFAVLQLARLLGLSRGREAVLLRARGLARGQAVSLAAGESLIVTIAGALVGLAAATGWLAFSWGEAGPAALTSVWPVAVGGIVALAATLTVGQLRASRAAEHTDSAAGRIARAASPGAAVLLLLIAALLVWQARSSTILDDRWTTVIASLAPTVGVAAAAVLAVLLFGPVAAAVARAAGRSARLAPAYPARQVARRVTSFAVAVALVTIAVSGAVLAGAYAATWNATSENSARLQAGAPLRAHVEPVLPEDVAAAQGVSGVGEPAPAVVAEVVAGDVAGSLIALPAAAMAEVLFDVPGAADPATLAETLAVESASVPFPAEATGLHVTARTSGPPEALSVDAWLVDETGLALSVPLGVSAGGDSGEPFVTASAALPGGAEAWRLAAVEFSLAPGWSGEDLLLTEVDIAAVVGSAMEPLGLEPVDQIRLVGGGASAVWSAAGDDPARVPVAVTTAFASPLGLALGDVVDVRFEGAGRTAEVEVRIIADAVPGLGVRPGVLGALAALVENQLPLQGVIGRILPSPPLPNEVWATGDSDAAASLALALDADVTTPDDPTAPLTEWVIATWNTAAVGGALLAGVALVALLTSLTSQRAGEVLVLRALGIPSSEQSRMRAAETALVVVLAAVLGACGGLLLAALLIPDLVARAVPGVQLPPTLTLDPWPLIVTAIIVAAAWAGSAAGAAAAVAAQASSTRLEEAAA